MLEGTLQPIVIFFGLTNSLATFQVMMNDLLRNMIEVGDMVAFVDNVMVRMETKEGHDEIIEEVLRRIAENNLFVKPKKCMCKVGEVGFLGVMIKPDKVKMQKKKIQGVMNQLVPRSIKDVQKFLQLANYYKWFAKDFTGIAKPIYEMIRKEVK